MGDRKFCDQMMSDACQHAQQKITSDVDVTSLKDYVQVRPYLYDLNILRACVKVVCEWLLRLSHRLLMKTLIFCFVRSILLIWMSLQLTLVVRTTPGGTLNLTVSDIYIPHVDPTSLCSPTQG